MKKILVFIVLVGLIFNKINAQNNKSQQIDSLMHNAFDLGIFNGNILVIANNKTVYKASFGSANAAKNVQLTSDFRFNIGSIAKEFNGVAIMMLKEQDKLNLDDKVSKYIDKLPAWSNKISIKNLLQYSSGLPDINWKTIKNDADIFNDLKKIDTLLFEPNTNYYYNNNNVFLQRRIVEKITGISFNQYVQKYILKPCKMKQSIVDPSVNSPFLAKSFTDELKEDAWDIPMSGWTFVTTQDIYLWLKCLHNYKLINKNSLYELFQSFEKGKQSSLGNSDFEGTILKEHWHHGSSLNFEALIDDNIAENWTIILMTNNYNERVFAIKDAIKAILKNEKPQKLSKSLSHYFDARIDNLKIEEVILLYHKLKITNSYQFDFTDENDLNTMGYKLMNKKKLDDAIKIFELNTQMFPSSANAYDSLGEAYYAKGDFPLALFNYKKSLTLDPKNDGARAIIEKLNKN
jgi:CubicO group peptidase (beta-lactamase class C family)